MPLRRHPPATAAAPIRPPATGRAKVRPPLATRLRSVASFGADALVTAVLMLLALMVNNSSVVPALVALVVPLPLFARRFFPRSVFVLVLAGSLVVVAVGGHSDPYLVLAVALYTLSCRRQTRETVLGLVLTLVGIGLGSVMSLYLGATVIAGWTMAYAATSLAAWSFGRMAYQHRRYLVARRDRELAEAAMGERLRVARELHDVLAHGMSLIAVQASVANHVIDQHPEEARRALASIAETSRAGLAELRRLLATLRTVPIPVDDTDGGSEDGATLQPEQGIADLDALLARVRQAGLTPEIEIRGAQRPLPPGIGLAVYRIVQEALTNIVRHAGPVPCRVVVDYQPDALVVEVTNDAGHGSGVASGAGHGIRGMWERVAIYGGTLVAAPLPAPDAGFRVATRIPVGTTDPTGTAAAPRAEACT